MVPGHVLQFRRTEIEGNVLEAAYLSKKQKPARMGPPDSRPAAEKHSTFYAHLLWERTELHSNRTNKNRPIFIHRPRDRQRERKRVIETREGGREGKRDG